MKLLFIKQTLSAHCVTLLSWATEKELFFGVAKMATIYWFSSVPQETISYSIFVFVFFLLLGWGLGFPKCFSVEKERWKSTEPRFHGITHVSQLLRAFVLRSFLNFMCSEFLATMSIAVRGAFVSPHLVAKFQKPLDFFFFFFALSNSPNSSILSTGMHYALEDMENL